MAVTFDAKATAVTVQTTPSSPITNANLTVGASGTLVIGVFSAATSTTLAVPTAMTWNGATMTLVSSKIASDSLSSVYAYAIISPTTGNHTLSCTFTNGTGSQTVDLDCFSFTGTNTSSVASCIPSANVVTDASTPVGTVYPASAFTVTTVNGDAAVAVANSTSTAVRGTNVGTLINQDNTSLANYVSLYNLASSTSTQAQFGIAGGITGSPAEGIAFDIVQAAAASLPFEQPVQSPPYGIKQSQFDKSVALNPNLFKNPIPNNQFDLWLKKPLTIRSSLRDLSTPTNLNLYKNPIPILNIETGKYGYLRAQPQQQYSYNPNLYSVVAQNQPRTPIIVKSFRPGVSPDQFYPNINIFPNPVPFTNLFFDTVKDLPSLPPQQPSYNNLLYTVVTQTPTIPLDLSFSKIIPNWPVSTQYPNLVLQNFSTPLNIVDMSSSRINPDWLPVVIYPNLILQQPTTNPFYTQDFSRPFTPTLAKPDQQSVNINLYVNPIPFGPYDWQIPHSVQTGRQDNYLNLVIQGQVATPNPFFPIDLSRSDFLGSTLQFQNGLNINLNTNPIPFSQYDWPRVNGVKLIASDQTNLPDLVLKNFSTPFIQTDWSKSFDIPSIPFLQYPNIVLLNPVVVGNPFYLKDWSKTQFLPSVPQPPSGMALNINLNTNPIPFNKLDWTYLYPVRPIVSDQNNLPNIVGTHPSKPSTPLGIFYWTDWSKTKAPVILIPNQDNLPNIVLTRTPPPIIVLTGGGRRWLEGLEQVAEAHRRSLEIKKFAELFSTPKRPTPINTRRKK